jgi:hypothetical protein
MPERCNPVKFDVLLLGPVAARALARAGSRDERGGVRAVFDRCFDVEIAGDYTCIGVSDLGAGSINVLTNFPSWGTLIQGLRTGTQVGLSNGCVRVGNRLILNLAKASIWSPPTVSSWCRESVKSGLETWLDATCARVPDEGLGRLMVPDTRFSPAGSIPLKYAAGPVSRLQTWLRDAMLNPHVVPCPDAGCWKGLLGLGPGLTPSGDDLFGGILIALHALGCRRLLRSLSAAVMPILGEQTNAISGAHLRSAMEGLGCEPVHRAVNLILTRNRDCLSDVIEAVDSVGHTSGWDALAGVVIAMRLWIQSGQVSRSAA